MGDRGSGYIKWPKGKHWSDDGAGSGMWVYAYVLVAYEHHPLFEDARDPFIRCHGPEFTTLLPRPALVTSPNRALMYPLAKTRLKVAVPHPDDPERAAYLRSTLDAGTNVLAAVCLGSSPFVYTRRDGDGEPGPAWYCTPNDLTWRGRALLHRLGALYGERNPELVTYVDID